MKLCDYQILEYTTSELQTHGVSFIVVVRLHELILPHWKARIGAVSKGEVEEIEMLLRDIEIQRKEETEFTTLFERLGRLNVGPIRTFVVFPTKWETNDGCASPKLHPVSAVGKLHGS